MKKSASTKKSEVSMKNSETSMKNLESSMRKPKSSMKNSKVSLKTANFNENSKITGPTYLTLLRMLLSIIFLILILIPETSTRIVALIIFILASLTDKIDGAWARKRKIETDLGAFLDPLADKMLTSLAFLALVNLGIVPLWLFAIILVRDFAVDGMRMMAARNGITIAASFYGKLKTTIQMIALIILIFYLIVNLEVFMILGNIALYFSLILTIFSGIDYLLKGYKTVLK